MFCPCALCHTRPEYEARILRLVFQRHMTKRASTIVVDAAMYGKGCVEGKVREDIERKKKEPLSEEKGLTK
jgi:hypothetical protein